LLLDQIVKRRGGVLLDECTFVSCIIRIEVLRLCLDVEPLPNKGLGPGQLFEHQSQPKKHGQRRIRKHQYEHDGGTNLETRFTLFLLELSSLIVSMPPHAAARDMFLPPQNLHEPPRLAAFYFLSNGISKRNQERTGFRHLIFPPFCEMK